MRRILPATFAICLLAFAAALALPSVLTGPSRAQEQDSYARAYLTTTFASLGTPSNSSVRYCTNCQATSPCTSGGSGAVATRVNGAWNCSSGGPASLTGTVNITSTPVLQFDGTTVIDQNRNAKFASTIVGASSLFSWASNRLPVQLGQSFSIIGHSTIADGSIASNAYYNGTNWVYVTTNPVSLLNLNNGSGEFNFYSAASGTAGNNVSLVQVAKFDLSATANDTRFLVYDVNSSTLKRVSVGAADSGGSGFRVLRIPN